MKPSIRSQRTQLSQRLAGKTSPASVKLKLILTAGISVLLGHPELVQAATYTWDSDTGTTGAQDGGGAWSAAATNWWSGGANAAFGNTNADIAVFGAGSGAAGTITLGGAFTANALTFNAAGSGNYTLSSGTITLDGASAAITTNASATIGSCLLSGTAVTKSGAGILTLNPGTGVTSTIASLKLAGGGLAVSSGTLNVSALGAAGGSTGLWVNSGTFAVTGGVVNTTNYVTINGGGTLLVSSGTFFESGAEVLNGYGGTGTVTLSGSGVMNVATLRVSQGTGTVNLNGGTLFLNYFNQGGLTGTVNFNGATVTAKQTNATFTPVGYYTWNVLGGGAIFNTAGYNITIPNALVSGTANDGGLTKTGAGTLTLSATNTYAGPTTVSAGTLQINGTAGMLTGTGSIAVGAGATLLVGDSTAANNNGTVNRITPASALNLGGTTGGGTLTMAVPATTTSGTLASLILNGGFNLISANGATGATNLAFTGAGGAGYVRNANSILMVTSSTGFNPQFTNAPTAAGGSSVAGTAKPILVGVSLNGNDLVAAAAGTLAAPAYDTTWGSDATLNVTGGNLTASTNSVNALRFNDSTARTVTLLGTGTTVVQSGMILVGSAAANNQTITGGTITSGNGRDLIVWDNRSISQRDANAFYLSSVVADNGSTPIALNVSGSAAAGTSGGQVWLNNNNTYTGGTVLLGGEVDISADTAFGAVPASPQTNITVVGGGWIKTNAAVTLSANRNVSLAANSVLTLDGQNGTLTVNGAISGAGNLVTPANRAALVVLNGTNTFTGYYYNYNTLRAVDGVGLPTAANFQLSGNTLSSPQQGMLESSGSFTRSLGTGAGQVQWVNYGGGGFGAYGGPLTVALGGTASPASLTWGAGGFVSGGSGFDLQDNNSTSPLTWMNPINLGGAVRTFNISGPAVLSNSTSATMSGVLSNGGVTLAAGGNGGLLILTATNTYTQPTQVTQGMVLRAADGVGLPSATNLNLAGGTGSGDSIFEFLGGGSFTRTTGTGAGQVQFATGGSLSAGQGFSANGGPLTVNLGSAGATVPFAAEVLGITGSITNGSNLIAVSNTNGLAVGQVVSGNGVGGLKISAISSGTITMNGNAWATIGGDALTFVTTSNTAINGNILVLNETTANSALTFVNGLDLNGTGRQINVNANTAIVSGPIVNSGASGASLTKGGAGTLVLTAANTYDGGTTVSSGTLQIGNGGATGAIGSTSGVAVASGATLAFNRTDNYGGNFTLAISGSGGLLLAGGALTLAGANAFTGDTVLTGGTLTTGIATALQNSTLNYSNQGGTLSFGTLTAATLGGLKGAQNLTLLNTSGTGVNLSVGNNGANTIYTGLISGTNAASTLTKVGTGMLTLDPGAATSGTIANLIVNTGTMVLNSGTITNAGSAVNNSLIVGAGATLNLAGGSLINTNAYPTVNGTMNITGGTFNAGTAELLMAFNASVAALNLSGSGVLVANQIRMGNNSNPSTLNLNGGTLRMSFLNGSGNTAGIVNLNGSTLQSTNSAPDFLNNKSTYNVLAGGAIFNTAGYSPTVQAALLSGTVNDGGLTKNGAGTLTLSGSNSYTGATAINAGTLSLASAGALAGGGNITFGGGTLQFSGSNTNDYSGRIVNSGSAIALDLNGQSVAFANALPASNSGGLTLLGNGFLSISGSNAYTGATTVSSGTLQISGVLGSGSYAGAISDAGALIFSASADQSLSGALSGAGSLLKSGAGTLTLTGSNSYTGAITVNSGTLKVGDGTNGSLAAGSAITMSYGCALVLNLANSGTLGNAISNYGGVINLINSGTSTLSGNISGYLTGAVNQNGTGTTILTGNNTYFAPTNINAGILQLGSQYAADYSTVNVGVDNGLAFGVTPVTVGGLSGTNALSLVTTSGTGAALTIGNNNLDSTYTGTITGTNAASALIKTGSATFTYAPVTSSTINTLTVNQGKFLLTGGTLTVPNFLVSGTGVFEQTGGTLNSNPYPNVAGVGGATLNVLGGTFQGATELLIGFGTGVPGTVNVSGSGTLAAYWLRMGNNSNATVNLSTGGTIQAARFYTDGGISTLTMDGGIIQIATQSRTDFLQGLTNAYINAGGGTFNSNGYSSTVAQPLLTGIGLPGNDGGLKKTGAGTLTLSGSNTYNGGTTINNGTLQLGNASGLGASTGNLAVNNGTLDLNGNSVTVGTLSGSTGAITTSSNASVILTTAGSTSSTFGGVIQDGSGRLGLTQAGTGNLTLAGANTYTGDTTLSSGTLTLGIATALQNSTLNNQGGTLNFGTQTAATLGGLKGAQNIALLNTSGTGVALTVGNNNQSTTYTGLLSGASSASLTKSGTGTLTLDPGASTATSLGFLTANAGSLILKSGTFTNTGLDPSANGYSVGVGARGGMLTIDGAFLNVATGMLKPGAAANGNIAILSGTVNVGWDFVLGHNGTAVGTQSGGLVTAATMYHMDAGSASYTLTGGTLATKRIYDNTGSSNAFTLNLNGGTLESAAGTVNLIDNSGQNGAQVTVLLGAGNTVIDTTASSATIVRPMSDMSGQAGAFTKAGANTLTLSGSNSYSGGTTVSAGILKLANANALGTGALTVNAGTLDLNGNNAAVGALSGSAGAIVNTGSGTATLTTSVDAGTSTFNGSIANGTGSVVLEQTGAGTLILGGSLTIAGLNANEGTTQIQQSASIDTLSVAAGATVSIAANSDGNREVLNISSLTVAGFSSTIAAVSQNQNNGGAQAAIEPASPEAVPEPGALGMVLLGGAGMLAFARRLRRRSGAR